MKKVIELIRVSTEEQAADDRASIPAQREANKRTVLQYGLTVVRSIEFSDVSGASVLQAPEIQELIRLMQSPEIHGVVTREFSRLMRPENLGDFAPPPSLCGHQDRFCTLATGRSTLQISKVDC